MPMKSLSCALFSRSIRTSKGAKVSENVKPFVSFVFAFLSSLCTSFSVSTSNNFSNVHKNNTLHLLFLLFALKILALSRKIEKAVISYGF